MYIGLFFVLAIIYGVIYGSLTGAQQPRNVESKGFIRFLLEGND
jgi:hypothetical protein